MAFAARGISHEVKLELNDTAGVIEFVRAGLAVALVPPSMVAGVEGVALVPISPDPPTFATQLSGPGTDRRRRRRRWGAARAPDRAGRSASASASRAAPSVTASHFRRAYRGVSANSPAGGGSSARRLQGTRP